MMNSAVVLGVVFFLSCCAFAFAFARRARLGPVGPSWPCAQIIRAIIAYRNGAHTLSSSLPFTLSLNIRSMPDLRQIDRSGWKFHELDKRNRNTRMENMKIDKIENANEIPQRQRQRESEKERERASTSERGRQCKWSSIHPIRTVKNRQFV